MNEKSSGGGWRSRFGKRQDADERDEGDLGALEPWSTAFLIAGSALLGATAIAFWNRRTIAGLRAQLAAQESSHPSRSDEEII